MKTYFHFNLLRHTKVTNLRLVFYLNNISKSIRLKRTFRQVVFLNLFLLNVSVTCVTMRLLAGYLVFRDFYYFV